MTRLANADLARGGHMSRNAIEDYEFLVASGVSHGEACERTGFDAEKYAAMMKKRAVRG